MTKFLIASDLHYGSVNSNSDMKYFNISDIDFDCALLAGDIGVYDYEIEHVLSTYFTNKKVCFIGGNHMTYLNPTEEIHSIIDRHKRKYPIESDWSFMENDYKIIGNVVIIGCNLYTDYKLKIEKLFKRTVNENNEPTDINGRVLIKDPRDEEEFIEKRKKLLDLYFENKDIDIDNLCKDLYNSISPKINEYIENFKKRVSKEVFERWKSFEEDQKNQGYKEYSTKEYIRYNKNIAYRNMNDFRYGRIYDSKSLLGIRNLEPDDYLKWHKESLRYIDTIYKKFEDSEFKIVVMTHHCPTTKLLDESVCRKWKNSDMNSSYYSNLDKFIKKHPKIEYWICGHIHDRAKTTINNCKIIANPYGYNVLNESKGFEPVVIEL